MQGSFSLWKQGSGFNDLRYKSAGKTVVLVFTGPLKISHTGILLAGRREDILKKYTVQILKVLKLTQLSSFLSRNSRVGKGVLQGCETGSIFCKNGLLKVRVLSPRSLHGDFVEYPQGIVRLQNRTILQMKKPVHFLHVTISNYTTISVTISPLILLRTRHGNICFPRHSCG